MLRSCVEVLSKKGKLFAAMNVLYFWSIFAVVLLARFLFKPMLYESMFLDVPEILVGVDWPIMVAGIFLFNLVLSDFLVVTLPGLAFFPLSTATLMYRAFLWGTFLSQLPTPLFLAALPTFILEGEGYVLASVAGIMLGISWLKPNWIFKKETPSRWKALKKASEECLRIYILMAMILFVAAVVETFTILSLTT